MCWIRSLIAPLLAVALVACPPAPQDAGAPEHPDPQPVPAAGVAVDPRVRALLPDERDRRWEALPWHHDLLAARAAAERSGAPIFLWLMDGNPLGPT